VVAAGDIQVQRGIRNAAGDGAEVNAVDELLHAKLRALGLWDAAEGRLEAERAHEASGDADAAAAVGGGADRDHPGSDGGGGASATRGKRVRL
jgi:hypothetical protein